MYLRETRRKNKDGTVVSYLQLAHNERHPQTGTPTAKVIHNFGRADQVDREALRRLVASVRRFLEPAQAVAATAGSDVEIIDSRRFGGAFVLDQLWERLGIGPALRRAAAGRRLDAGVTERVLFALVANRCLEPSSKLAACRWVTERAAILSCPAFDDDAAYAAMDFLLAALGEIAEEIFARTANLLNLSCDVIFVDTSSTYFEVDVADELAELATALGEQEAKGQVADQDVPDEEATRRFSKHSKDHRPDLPQVVLGMAVTAEGIPVRCWTFPGTTSDQVIIKKIKDDLAGWSLHRVVWVADSGFNSAANRGYLQKGGGHYIVAERVRGGSAEARAALARAGRYHAVAGNLEVKQVRLGDGARSQRFVICHNPEVAARDKIVRGNLLAYLQDKIAGTDDWPQRRDELAGELRTTPALFRLLRRTKGRQAADQQGSRRERGPLRREVPAPHLRRHPYPRRPGRRLQAALPGRAGLAGPEGGAAAAAGLPLPRRPHPRPHPALLARAPAHPHHRVPGARHLAQHPPRARPHAPGHPPGRPRPRRPALGDHPRPAAHLQSPQAHRASPLPRLRAGRARRVKTQLTASRSNTAPSAGHTRFPSSAPLSGTLVCLTSPEVRSVHRGQAHMAAADLRGPEGNDSGEARSVRTREDLKAAEVGPRLRTED